MAPSAAGVEVGAGAAGTEAALAAKTPGVEPLGRPRYPAAAPAVGAGVVVWVAETMAALAAPSGVKPQGRPLDSAIAPAAGAEAVVVGAKSLAFHRPNRAGCGAVNGLLWKSGSAIKTGAPENTGRTVSRVGQFGFHAAAVSSQQHGHGLSWFSELIPQKISLLLAPRTQGGGGGGALTETKSRVRGLKREMSQLESIQACLALKLEAQLQQGFRAQMNLQVSLGTRWWPIDPNNSAHPTASSHSWTDNHRASGLKARRGRASARASHFHAQSSSRIRQVNVHMQRLSLSATRCRVDGFGQHMGRAARIRRPQADESMRWPRGAADGCFPLEALFVV